MSVIPRPLFDGKRMTAREARIAREAFVEGAMRADTSSNARKMGCVTVDGYIMRAESAAAKLYPPPTIKRPREVTDPHVTDVRWRVVCDSLQIRRGSFTWEPASAYSKPTKERVALWADLFARPEEEVEDPGDDCGPGRE